MVEVAPAGREDVVAGGDNRLALLLQRLVEVHPAHAQAWRHQIVDALVAEPEDAIDDLALGGLHDPRLSPLPDQDGDLLLRDSRVGRGLHPEHAQDGAGGEAEEADQRARHARQPAHRARYQRGDRLGVAERQLLGHQFADDQREVGDDGDRDPEADLVAVGGQAGYPRDAAPDRGPQAVATECAGEDADQGDADLHRGEEAAGVVRQVERGLRARIARLGAPLQADLSGGGDGEFGHREDSIGDDQQEQQRDLYANLRHGADNPFAWTADQHGRPLLAPPGIWRVRIAEWCHSRRSPAPRVIREGQGVEELFSAEVMARRRSAARPGCRSP